MVAHMHVIGADGQVVVLAQHDADFQRIDRIESDAVGVEERRVVVDIGGGQVFQIEGFDEELLNFEFLRIHGRTGAG
jgi:hypothetical protein